MLDLALSLVLAQASAATGLAQPPPPERCESPRYNAFDFWIGEWAVFPKGKETQVAESRIEKVSAGCAIRETWMPLRGGGGASLTAYDPADGAWHQLWIGETPGRVFFDGGPIDGAMVLTGYWGKDEVGNPSLVRMTYDLQDDGSVRQHGEASSDHGLTWRDSFDLVYRRKEPRK